MHAIGHLISFDDLDLQEDGFNAMSRPSQQQPYCHRFLVRCLCVADVVFCSAYFIHGVVCVFVFSACAAAALRFACVAQ